METDFLDTMNIAGIPPAHPLIYDGNFRRYRVQGDKKGRKNGWYRFTRFNADFAVGVFGCNRTGISGKWTSKEKSQITAYDKRKVKERNAQIEAEDLRVAAAAALKANELWGRSVEVGDKGHAYLSNKGIPSYGLRELHNSLVIPISVDNYIVSLQFIMPDGYKRYLTGGKKEGGYYIIEASVPGTNIYICEGYATGASIAMATGAAVVLAFDAGNLVPVAAAIRAKFPDSKIIMAADNDQWTPGNPGLSKAQEAADKSGATVLFPRFDPQGDKLTDWNDFHKKHGLKFLAEEIIGIKRVAAVTPSAVVERQWQRSLIEGKQELAGFNDFDAKSNRNVRMFMTNHDKLKGLLIHDIFADRILLRECPPWENKETFVPREVNGTDALMYVDELETFGLRTRKEITTGYIEKIAKQNPVNPAKDYFESLKWDGQPRIDKWLTYYCGAEFQDEKYLALVGSKWLMGAVSRIYRPGVQFRTVLILEGKQEIGKTEVFKRLATIGSKAYFLSFVGDIRDKDSWAAMQGNIIIEMAELATLLHRKTDIETMKDFISKTEDRYRAPYAVKVETRPRYFVFGATSNRTGDYLEDDENTRFWPVGTGTLDLDALDRDKAQLWAEAIHRWKAGELTYLVGEERDIAKLEQDKRKVQDAWFDTVREYIIQFSEVSTSQIMTVGLNIPNTNKNDPNLRRVKRILQELRWTEHRTFDENGERQRVWHNPNSLKII